MTVTGSSLPGDPVTATLTSPVRPSPGSPRLIPNGCGVSAPAPMTRSVAAAPASAASVASTVTRMTWSARPECPALPVNRSVDSTPVIRMPSSSHARGTATDLKTGKSAGRAAARPKSLRKNSSERLLSKQFFRA